MQRPFRWKPSYRAFWAFLGFGFLGFDYYITITFMRLSFWDFFRHKVLFKLCVCVRNVARNLVR